MELRGEGRNAEVVGGAAKRPHTTMQTTKTMDRTEREVVVEAEAEAANPEEGVEDTMPAMTHQTERRNGIQLKNRKWKIVLREKSRKMSPPHEMLTRLPRKAKMLPSE